MIETVGLTHIHFAVSDLPRSLKFYQDVFGLQVKFWSGSSMVFLGTPGAVDTITLRQAVKGEPVGMGGGFGHFGFRQPQKKRTEGIKKRELVDIGVQEVLNAGGSLVEKGEHVPGHYYAYVSDPDGYVIEL